MFYFIFRTSFLHGKQTIAASQSSNLFIFKRSIGLRLFSNSSNGHSFTVFKLWILLRIGFSECGFSSELASRVSNCVHFETPEKPDSLIVFLENHGFSQTQIVNLIKRQPTLLLSDTEKTLSPKLEFLYSIGFSRPELAKLLSSNPLLLKSSLKKQIIPSFNLLRNLFQSNDKTIKAIKRFDGILVYHAYVFSDMKVLRGIGVPESNILMMFSNPPALLCNPVRLKEIVEDVKRMGFDSLTKKFVHVVIALSSMSKSTLEKKFDVYRRWGWSDQEIREAFQRYPSCITASEDKIMAIMDFLSQSFEKRIVPRALFARELLSLGLVGNLTLSVLFDTLEKVFVNRFVNIAPELLMLYEERRSQYRLQH
ncbi:hypothetical protein E1A91_D01G027600v1 [Gossypium mustelinum]|uniref:Uncharacterized protein n=1 Tax=Gossypium mustelinum TaxID=34275 RepID=A0A5D2W2H6_GOSMU|nr:hypothetical protein E1A91_D01G027600v1 [Gossypium mustelinum]